jgi:hypothetical protein
MPVPFQIGTVFGPLVIEFQLKSKAVPGEILGIKMEIIPHAQLLAKIYILGVVDFIIFQSRIKKKTIPPAYTQDDWPPLFCSVGNRGNHEKENERCEEGKT